MAHGTGADPANYRRVPASTFRILRGEYRRAVAELNSLCHSAPPKTYSDRLRLLDELMLAQDARRCIADEGSFAEAVLGELWAGEDLEWPKIQGLVEWVEQCEEALPDLDFLRSEVISAKIPWDTLAAEIETEAVGLQAGIDRIVKSTGAESKPILGTASWDDAPISALIRAIDGWCASLDVYNDWVAAREALDLVRKLGLELIANGLYDGSLEPSTARPKTDLLPAEALWRRAWSGNPVLDEIDGVQRSECVEDFRALDRKRIEVSQAEVLRTYLSQRPTGSGGEMGVIRAEGCWSVRLRPSRRSSPYS